MPDLSRRRLLQAGLALAGTALLPRCGVVEEAADLNAPFDTAISMEPVARVASTVDRFHFPHFVNKDGVLNAYFIDHSGASENDVGMAVSLDGINFTYRGKVLEKGAWYDSAQASFPAAQYVDGTWHLLYEGKDGVYDINSVCWATSRDGMNWTKKGPVIRPNNAAALAFMPDVPTPGPVADVDVGTPTFFHDGSVWHVYYHMTKQEPWTVRIGYATGTSLDALTCSPMALVDVQGAGELESGTVGARSNVVRIGQWYYMAYEWSTAIVDGSTSRAADGAGPSKAFANSWWGTSLLRSAYPGSGWKRWDHNPLLRNPAVGFGYDGPELLYTAEGLYLYYRADGNNTWRTKLVMA
jgi:hypothetical protein